MTDSIQRDQILQFVGAVTVLLGIPAMVVVLVIRGVFKRRRELAAWRDCARRHGWSEGSGASLLSGSNDGISWSLGVEGSEQDDIIWRGGSLPGDAVWSAPRISDVTARVHAALSSQFRTRFPLRALTVDVRNGALELSLRNRDLTCDDAAGLVRLGLAIAQGLTRPGAP